MDRKFLAAHLEKTRNSCDCWIAYLSMKRLGKRLAWASDNREIGRVSLSVACAALTIKARGEE
eukprot:11224838-Lingulodinium_polyedra.AAC.1